MESSRGEILQVIKVDQIILAQMGWGRQGPEMKEGNKGDWNRWGWNSLNLKTEALVLIMSAVRSRSCVSLAAG